VVSNLRTPHARNLRANELSLAAGMGRGAPDMNAGRIVYLGVSLAALAAVLAMAFGWRS